MFCNIMLWIDASELINFETKYPYMHRFGISCNTWIWSSSKVFSMLVMAILPHALLSTSRIMLSTLSLK